MRVFLQIFKTYNIALTLLLIGISGHSFGQRVSFSTASQTVSETVTSTTCNASKIVNIGITSIQVPAPETITFMLSGTATMGDDFLLSQNTLEVNGTMTYTIELEVIDDAEVEDDETVQIDFVFNGETSTTVITITDDDAVPILGNTPVELLNQGFDVSALPEGWQASQSLDTGLNIWKFNGTGLAAGTAYISFDPFTTPVYDAVGANPAETDASSNALLVSPIINSQGLGNPTVSFDWMAGGETDPMAEGDAALFDYGTFLFSLDGGSSFSPVENFVGIEGVGAQAGTFSMEMPELANQQFQLAFRWINDQLISSAFSFTIDNVVVTAPPLEIETALGGSDQEVVDLGNDIFFISDENNRVIARIEGASEDLGCIEVAVTSAGSSALVANDSQQFNRASKVIEIFARDLTNPNATYDITLYFTAEEVGNFSNLNDLQLLKVEGGDIDATTDTNFVLSGGLLEDNTANGFLTFRGSFSGFGSSFSIAEPLQTQGVDEFAEEEFKLFPNTIASGTTLNIVSNNTQLINTVEIYTLSGRLLKSVKMATPVNSTTVSTGAMSSGIYLVTINKTTKNSLKLIVR